MSAQDAAKALAMIQRAKAKGRAADLTFSRPGADGTYSPETGQVEGGTPLLSFDGVAVILPASQGTVEAFDVTFKDGSLIESKLRALLIAAKGMAHDPMPGDTVTFPDGKVGTLIGCTPLNPDGMNPIVYQGTAQL